MKQSIVAPILRLHSQTTRLKEKIQHPRRNVEKYNTVPPNPSTKKRKENENFLSTIEQDFNPL
jgi:hypothetical protein